MLHYLSEPLKAARPTRRTFLKMSAGAAGGLLIGAAIPRVAAAQAADGALATPFVHVTPDNVVTVIVKHLDKGQGAATGLATLVAEELDAAPEQVAVEFAPANTEVYQNLLFGIQGTGGSTAIANSFEQYRQAGATARAMLVEAAAQAWGVAPAEVTVSAGTLSAGEMSASFGDMAAAAAEIAAPAEVTLKAPEDWIYIGKSFPRVDVPQKTRGSVGMYGMDVAMDGQLYAATLRPPRFGGRVASVDAAAALGSPGVVDVLEIPQGVVVVAESTWTAMTGRDALSVEWDFSEAENRGTDEIVSTFRALLDEEGLPAGARGDTATALEGAAQVVEADFVFPLLAHAPLEPLNITVLYDGETVTFWTGAQIQTLDQNFAAGALGLDPSAVFINTRWGGGSFGRRATFDAHLAVEGAMIGRAWLERAGEARPIKMVYSREDDVRGGYYRPINLHRVRAGLDAEGNVSGWQHRIVGQSLFIGTPLQDFLVEDGVDHSATEGTLDTPYAIPDFVLDVHHPETGVPVLWWRSVGHTHTAYVMETMMDELAAAAGADPVEFRLRYLADVPRMAGVLRRAADEAGWGTPAPEGRFRGVAVHQSFGTYAAEVAEVSLREDGTVKVEKVVCAVDCGVAVNPDNIRAQIEGGIGYGLSAILREEITMTEGEVDQWNYPDYTPLRISDMPEIEVHIVESAEAPTGIGEPGTPPIGPAVANAVAAATGTRVRELPFTRHSLA